MRRELKPEDVIRTKDETGAGQRKRGWKESVAGREKRKGGKREKREKAKRGRLEGDKEA